MPADLRTEMVGDTCTVFRVLTPFMHDAYLSAGEKFLVPSSGAQYDSIVGMEVFPSREVLDAVLHGGWLGEHFRSVGVGEVIVMELSLPADWVMDGYGEHRVFHSVPADCIVSETKMRVPPSHADSEA